jgi:CRP-like cAMP-binding protein
MGSGLEELGIVDDIDDTAVSSEGSGAHAKAGADKPDSEIEFEWQQVQGALSQVTLFDGLLPLHLRRIAQLAQRRDYEKNDFVFRHGDDGDGLYLILQGAIRISRNVSGIGEEALAILRPGQYFGEMSIVDDAPRSADAIGHEPSQLLRIAKDDLRDLMFVDRELAYELLWRFIRTLSGRLRESNDRLLMLTVSSRF